MRSRDFIVEMSVANPQMAEKIRQLKLQGLTAQQIASQVGLSLTAVNSYIYRYGLRPFPLLTQMNNQQRNYILQQFQSGIPLRHLAKQYHIGPDTLTKFLKPLMGVDQYLQRAKANDPAHKGTTPEQIQIWANEFANGAAINSLSQKFKMTSSNMRYWLEQLPNWQQLYQSNLQHRKYPIGDTTPKGITQQNIQQMAQMFVRGEPYTSIAKQFNIDDGLVGRYLKKLPNFAELKQQHLNLRPSQFGGRQATTNRMTNKPLTKGIQAIKRTGPNIR